MTALWTSRFHLFGDLETVPEKVKPYFATFPPTAPLVIYYLFDLVPRTAVECAKMGATQCSRW